LHKLEIGRRSCTKLLKTRKKCACGDGCHETAGESVGDRQAQSSWGVQQCACKASSAYESEGGNSPTKRLVSRITTWVTNHTSSSDQDLLPPAESLRARRLEGSGDCEFISGRGERIWGWWWSMVKIGFVLRIENVVVMLIWVVIDVGVEYRQIVCAGNVRR
jgi:hypothetical protein